MTLQYQGVCETIQLKIWRNHHHLCSLVMKNGIWMGANPLLACHWDPIHTLLSILARRLLPEFRNMLFCCRKCFRHNIPTMAANHARNSRLPRGHSSPQPSDDGHTHGQMVAACNSEIKQKALVEVEVSASGRLTRGCQLMISQYLITPPVKPGN